MSLPYSSCRFSLRFFSSDGELIAAFNSDCERTVKKRQKGAEALGLYTRLFIDGKVNQ